MGNYRADNKTTANEGDVDAFVAAVEPERRRDDALRLLDIFRETTGWNPVMWGASIVGFGQYHFVYDSGREGDFLATGFAPRKAKTSIYVMPGYADFQPLLDKLGKHGKGKACLYVNRLSDIDESVLRELIRAGLDDLADRWDVHPT